MKKIFSIISALTFLFVGCSPIKKDTNNIKDYSYYLNYLYNKKPEEKPPVEVVKRTVVGEEVNCGKGRWVHVWSGNETRKVVDDYRFNETIVIADGDRNLTTCAKVSGTYSWDGYEVTMTKVNLDYYDVDSKNKNSVYIRGDGKRIRYELRTNATLTITDVWEFIEDEEE
jgi:hypothetical protein